MNFKKSESSDYNPLNILLCVAIAAMIASLIALMIIHASEASGYDIEGDQFIRVAKGYNHVADTVVYDRDTKVMYVVNNEGYYWVLYNPDGTPRTYEESEE